MDELEKNIPDDFWRKSFDDAAETPPPRVWDSIERQLNESNGPKIIPLWSSGLTSSRSVLWGTGLAAALALLMVGWWTIRVQHTPESVARIQASRSAGNVAQAPVTSNSMSAHPSTAQPADVAASVSTPSNMVASSTSQSAEQLTVNRTGDTYSAQTVPGAAHKPSPLSMPVRVQMVPQLSTTGIGLRLSSSVGNRMAVSSFASTQPTVSEGVALNQSATVAFEQLRSKSIRLRSLGPIQRIVWYQPTEVSPEAELVKQKRRTREKWASASVMPGSFSPMVALQSGQTGYATLAANTSKTNPSVINSRASFSVAYQAGAGVQLTERWSVESGIGYLAGHSIVESPAQSVTPSYVQGITADRTTVVSNAYVDALRNSLSARVATNAPAANDVLAVNNAYFTQTNASVQTRQNLTNDYQYMQVPIQVGYQLRPRKRLSLAVLGGILTNIFVRNTVGSELTITAKDGVYRPVSLAATMGARFRYRPSGRWSASLAGLYQPSLESGTQSDTQVQTHPTSAGMSFGVDYHF